MSKTMTLQKDGWTARYLGFCLNTGNYNPRSFCSLSWLLTISPILLLVLPLNKFSNYIVKLRREHRTKIEEDIISRLAARYVNNPNLLLIDYFRARYPYKVVALYSMKSIDIARFWKTIELLQRNLALPNIYTKEFWAHFDIETENYALDIDFLAEMAFLRYLDTLSTNKPKHSVKQKIKNKVSEICKISSDYIVLALIVYAIGILFTAIYAVAFNPVLPINGLLVYPVIAAAIGTIILAAQRSGLLAFLYTGYRAVKDRTCPIIQWE